MKYVVSLLGQKGGVGKSTLARALAVACARADINAALVDLDYRQRTSARWSETRPPTAHGRFDTHTLQSIKAALPLLQRVDMLIVDTPGFITEETHEIAAYSNLVLLPTGASTDDLLPTLLLIEDLIRYGIKRERLLIALCRMFDTREEEVARSVLKYGGYEVLAGSIPEEGEYRRTQNQGKTITETSDPSLNRRANELLANALRHLLEEAHSRPQVAAH